jgi:triphosphoribosyl-dephospho-CoA synthetase
MGIGVHEQRPLSINDDWFSLLLTMARMRLELLPWEQGDNMQPAKMLQMKKELMRNGFGTEHDKKISEPMRTMFNEWLKHFKNVYDKGGDVQPSILIKLMQEASVKVK